MLLLSLFDDSLGMCYFCFSSKFLRLLGIAGDEYSEFGLSTVTTLVVAGRIFDKFPDHKSILAVFVLSAAASNVSAAIADHFNAKHKF